MVVMGADRIAADGSVANKVGTYSLAVLAGHHEVPFVVVAPVSTVDLATRPARAITIEHRTADEVTSLAGKPSRRPGRRPTTRPSTSRRRRW